MPDWEKIEFNGKSLKRKGTYNEFGRKTRFEPLESIPKFKRLCMPLENYQNCRETLIWKEDEYLSDKTSEFIKFAIEKGFTEEQALHIIKFNNFDLTLSECDLEIYKPLNGMRTNQNRDIIKMIIETIKARKSNRFNRDLNLILSEFPAHTMGELLDFYANNRMSIKRKTVKCKSESKGIKRKNVVDYLSQINPLLCGWNLFEYFSMNNPELSNDNIDLSDLLDLNRDKLDKALGKFSFHKPMEAVDNEEKAEKILAVLENRSIEIVRQPDEEEDLTENINRIFSELDKLETWMKPIGEIEQNIRHKWDNADIGLLLLGLQEFGPNFDLLADAIATKTSAMVKSFFLIFKDKYQLDKIALQIGSIEPV